METKPSPRTLARPRKLPLAAFFFSHLKMETEYKHVFGQSQRQPLMNRCIIDDERDCATVDLLLSSFAEDAMFVRWVHEQEVRLFFFPLPSESPIRSGGERSSTRSNLRFSRNARHLLERSGSEGGQILRSEYEIASVDSFRGKCERSIGKVLVLVGERHSFL